MIEVICTKTENNELVDRVQELLEKEIWRLGSVFIDLPIVLKHTASANHLLHGRGTYWVFEVTNAY